MPELAASVRHVLERGIDSDDEQFFNLPTGLGSRLHQNRLNVTAMCHDAPVVGYDEFARIGRNHLRVLFGPRGVREPPALLRGERFDGYWLDESTLGHLRSETRFCRLWLSTHGPSIPLAMGQTEMKV